MNMIPEVDQYLKIGCGRCELGGTPDCKVHTWPEELSALRMMLLDSELEETLKWGVPCYTWEGKNIAILSALKQHCVLGFFKGVLLKDPDGVLVAPGKNSQSDRQLRSTSMEEVVRLEPYLRGFIREAIEIERAGLKVDFKAKTDLAYPAELQEKLDADPALNAAFEALTPGRKRGYVLHFSQPKQAATRTRRVEKYIPKILSGKGFHDR